jgi:hypothetical protein
MGAIPLGGGLYLDSSTGKTFSKTGGGYFAGQAEGDAEMAQRGQTAKAVSPVAVSKESAAAPAPAAIPVALTETKPQVKAATPDLIQITEDGMAIEVITDLLFEDLGGTEILNIARHDLVNGIDVRYQQISNLAKIQSTFGGPNLISIQNSIEQIFNRFPLKRYQYVPTKTDDPSGLNRHLYADASGNIIIELDGLEDTMQIEIEFKAADTTDIIY